MTKQIMSLTVPCNGTWKIIQDDSARYNPFRVYWIADGHRRLLNKYADLASCLHYITQQLTGYEWRKTDIRVEQDWRKYR